MFAGFKKIVGLSQLIFTFLFMYIGQSKTFFWEGVRKNKWGGGQKNAFLFQIFFGSVLKKFGLGG